MINPLLSLIGALSVLIPEASSSFSGISYLDEISE